MSESFSNHTEAWVLSLRSLPRILVEEGDSAELYTLLTDFTFIEDKVVMLGAYALSTDYDLPFTHNLISTGGQDLHLIRDALRLVASMLDQPRHRGDRSLLRGQLYGRLMSETAPTITALLAQIHQREAPWLCPLTPNLTRAGGALQHTFVAHTRAIQAVARTADGTQVVSLAEDHTVKLWDLHTGAEVSCLMWPEDDRIKKTLLSTDALFVVSLRKVDEAASPTGDEHYLATVWEIATGLERVSFRVPYDSYNTETLLTPDNTRLVLANKHENGDDCTITVWDLTSGALLLTIAEVAMSLYQVVTTHAGQRLLTRGGGTLNIWDLATGQRLHTLKSPLSGITAEALSPDGRRAVVGLNNGTLLVWDLTTRAAASTLTGHGSSISHVRFHPDGVCIISLANNGTIKLWNDTAWATRVKLRLQRIAQRVIGPTAAIRSFTGHEGWVNAVAITPNGQQVVSASDDQTLKVWNLATGELLRTLRGHTGWVRAVALTPNGRWIISGAFDRTLKVWDLASGTLLRTLTGHTHKIGTLALTRDGRYVLSGSFDHTLRMWQLSAPNAFRDISYNDGKTTSTGAKSVTPPAGDEIRPTPLHTLGHAGTVRSIAVSPDGSYAAFVASEDGMLKLWDLEQGTLIQEIPVHGLGWVNALALTQDLHWLVMGALDHTIRLLQLQSGAVRTLTGHTDEVETVALTPDGRYLISGSSDHTLKIWELASGHEVGNLSGHTRGVRAVAVTPNGRYVLSAGFDDTLKLWDLQQVLTLRRQLATRAIRTTWNMEVATLDPEAGTDALWLAPDGRQIVTNLWDHTIQVWNLDERRKVQTFRGHANHVAALDFMPDGQHIVSGDSDGLVKVWGVLPSAEPPPVYGHSNNVTKIVVTPDGRHAISASMDHTLKLWATATGAELHTLAGHFGSVAAVIVTPNGELIISGSNDATLKVWATATGAEQWTLSGHTADINALAVTPDGRCVISASDDQTLKVWDLVTGELLRTLSGHRTSVNRVAVTPDGQHVISAALAGKMKVWHLASGREVRTLTDLVIGMALTPDGQAVVACFAEDYSLHLWELATGVRKLTFENRMRSSTPLVITPDGERLIGSSETGELSVWDTRNGAQRYTLPLHTTTVTGLQVSRDGQRVVSASLDGTIKLWEVASGAVHASFGVDGPIMDCALTPDGMTIIVGERTGRVHFLQLLGR
ncbi:MAG: WD40 repeat domain-containing protein [Chloroflexales bacterium]